MMKTLLNLFPYCKKSYLLILFVALGFAVHAGGDNDFQNAQVRVVRCYPNPATSFINFDFQKNIDENYSFQIFNFSGKKMIEAPVSTNKILISLNDFYRGIYIYQLHDKTGKLIESGKFQVVK